MGRLSGGRRQALTPPRRQTTVSGRDLRGSNTQVAPPLNLTTETTSAPPPNKPISGKEPEIEVDPTRPGVILSRNGVYVDNSFSAPTASGCVLTLFGFIPISINGLVNSQSGLPAAAGTNETVQNFNLNLAPPGNVYP